MHTVEVLVVINDIHISFLLWNFAIMGGGCPREVQQRAIKHDLIISVSLIFIAHII